MSLRVSCEEIEMVKIENEYALGIKFTWRERGFFNRIIFIQKVKQNLNLNLNSIYNKMV